jgi:hypothetical protein
MGSMRCNHEIDGQIGRDGIILEWVRQMLSDGRKRTRETVPREDLKGTNTGIGNCACVLFTMHVHSIGERGPLGEREKRAFAYFRFVSKPIHKR